jgi:hypothetical protein
VLLAAETQQEALELAKQGDSRNNEVQARGFVSTRAFNEIEARGLYQGTPSGVPDDVREAAALAAGADGAAPKGAPSETR